MAMVTSTLVRLGSKRLASLHRRVLPTFLCTSTLSSRWFGKSFTRDGAKASLLVLNTRCFSSASNATETVEAATTDNNNNNNNKTIQDDNDDDPSESLADTSAAKESRVGEEDTVIVEQPKVIVEQPSEKVEFKADTRKILDIMTHSLYTDKQAFLRELVSNASDALEKLRYSQAANDSAVIDPETPLEIRIDLDEVESSITITDTGIGMTREEMVINLGTIARSGSTQFIQDLQRVNSGSEIVPGQGIVGKFGVGFYSVFMVSTTVEVTSRSALKENIGKKPQRWKSDGNGYELSEVEDGIRVGRGTSVKMFLDSDYWAFVSEKTIEDILRKYSNFIGFPIYLMGRKVNTVDALWAKDPHDVSEERYTEFYRYIANSVDAPLATLHFRVDAPLDVKALLYIPSFHQEKYGMARIEPSVALYCRKVLIEAKSPDILPDWMRFVTGVVDSEDLPLSVSREKPQDSALIAKLKRALTLKFLAHLAKMQKNDRKAYLNEFYKEFSYFLKEGICHDHEFQPQLAKLLYFETSKNSQDEVISLDEYIARMRPEQNDIFYLCAPTRDAAITSPYMEMFVKAKVEVLFIFKSIDDFAMGSMDKYEGRKIVSIEKADINLSDLKMDESDNDDDNKSELYTSDRTLTPTESVEFCNWYRTTLKEKVASCSITDRLSSAPAIVTGHESAAIRRVLRSVDTSGGERDQMALPKQHVEVNPKHPLVVGIYDLVHVEPALARILAEQLFDNCLAAAGLLDDNRTMLPRLNDLLICLVKAAKGQPMFTDRKLSSDPVGIPSNEETSSVAQTPPNEKGAN